MSIFTGIVLYVIIYWLMLFTVLPWGNRADETVEEGHMNGAPANPRIKQKFIITFFVAAVVWVIVFLLIHFEIIDFYSIAQQMEQEDLKQ